MEKGKKRKRKSKRIEKQKQKRVHIRTPTCTEKEEESPCVCVREGERGGRGERGAVSNVEILVEGEDRVQRSRPPNGGVHGVPGTVQLSQGQGVESRLSAYGQASDRQPPAGDHCHFRQRSRREVRCHHHLCPNHQDHDFGEGAVSRDRANVPRRRRTMARFNT